MTVAPTTSRPDPSVLEPRPPLAVHPRYVERPSATRVVARLDAEFAASAPSSSFRGPGAEDPDDAGLARVSRRRIAPRRQAMDVLPRSSLGSLGQPRRPRRRGRDIVSGGDRGRRADYERHVQSSAWRDSAARREELRLSGGRCRLCGRGAPAVRIEVHHRTYARFGHERVEDLTTLCRECHVVVTDALRRRRYAATTLPPLADTPRVLSGRVIPDADLGRSTCPAR